MGTKKSPAQTKKKAKRLSKRRRRSKLKEKNSYKRLISTAILAFLMLFQVALFQNCTGQFKAAQFDLSSTSTSTVVLPCTPNVQAACTVPNGTGVHTCDASGLSWGACVPNLCNSGFNLSNGACVADFCTPNANQICTDGSGQVGNQTCNASGTAWGSCSPVDVTITLDGSSPGKVFEGVGALSGGASSRLLIDYPEPQRSEVLDFLFKPNYGAGFQELKVEIGSDANSTMGSEPSYARTRDEFNNQQPAFFNRGYEFWLMSAAKQRNPNVTLGALQLGFPGWANPDAPGTDPNWAQYSTDNANFVAGFVKGAQQYYGLKINYVGVSNEMNFQPYEHKYLPTLRNQLNAWGLTSTVIVADDFPSDWSRATDLLGNADLRSNLGAFGIHYPSAGGPTDIGLIGKWASSSDNQTAQNLSNQYQIPLWATEDGALQFGTWDDATWLAKAFNRNYIVFGITKTVLWNPVTSYYDNIDFFSDAGEMNANQPWSGHYEVRPTIWAAAHTNQFAQSGWHYLNSACGLLDGGNSGSYVSLRSPDGSGNYSMIIETIDASASKVMGIALKNLSTTTVHIWKSDSNNQFVKQADIVPSNGAFTITLAPGSIYSLTTTTGQSKGQTSPPAAASFPFPYSDNFQSYNIGQSPKYFQDQQGAFEVYQTAGEAQTLRQVAHNNIPWIGQSGVPYTIFGDMNWTDYQVSASALIEPSGQANDTSQASIFGRINSCGHVCGQRGIISLSPVVLSPTAGPFGYGLSLDESGNWTITISFEGTASNGTNYLQTRTLASGAVAGITANSWHTLSLFFVGSTITGAIDGALVGTVTDATYAHGMAGLGTGFINSQTAVDFSSNYSAARFAHLTVRPSVHAVDIGVATASYQAVGVADFNRDGSQDVLFQSTGGDVGYWALKNGTNPNWKDVATAGAGYKVFATADMNGDGIADILAMNSATGAVGYLAVNADGSGNWVAIGTASSGYHAIGASDFNGDGSADILFQSDSGDVGYWALKNGANPSWVDIGIAGTGYKMFAIADMNGDHVPDILFQSTSGDVGYWALHANGSIQWFDIGTSTSGYHAVGVADFNGDGNLDILFQGDNGDVGYWALVNGANPSWIDAGPAGGYKVFGISDMNNDGTPDVLFQNPSTGDVSFWPM